MDAPSTGPLWILAPGFAILLLIALSKRDSTRLPGRGFQLFRALFPSWRFFDDIGEMPVLYYRVLGEQGWGDWLPGIPKARRSGSTFWANPQGNYVFACHSLLQQLVSDLTEWDEAKLAQFDQSVSYQLVKNLVAYQLSQGGKTTRLGDCKFQFKICSVSAKSKKLESEDLLISPQFGSRTEE